MICKKCNRDSPENEFQTSHDVPTYMFLGDHNKSDKCGRHRICKRCHDIYERIIPSIIIRQLDNATRMKCINAVWRYSKKYFEVKRDGDTKAT